MPLVRHGTRRTTITVGVAYASPLPQRTLWRGDADDSVDLGD